MSWKSPNLSKGDVELLTVSLDDYIFYAKQENSSDTYEVERLLVRLEEYLQRSN